MTLATSSNLQKPKTFLFCGDNTAKKSIYLANENQYGVGGLPINDNVINRMFRKAKRFDIVFFHCTYPLAGCKEIETIKSIQSKSINERLFSYRHKPDKRGFYNDNWWKNLSNDDINFLFQNWAEMLNYYYQENPNLVLMPIKAHWHDRQLNLPNKAMQTLAQFDRVVDLSPLENYDEANYIDEFSNLSEQGFNLIKNNIFEWVKI